MCIVSDYRHTCAIRNIFVENNGIRLCFIDEQNDTFIYNLIDDILIPIPTIGPLIQYKNCLWEMFTIDRNTFVLHDENSIFVFIISNSLNNGIFFLF